MPSLENYRYCETCDMFFDYWKYGNLEDAGHDEHTVRMLTQEEFKNAVEDCAEEGCFDE